MRRVVLFFLIYLGIAAIPVARKTRVWLIGDSTMAWYDSTRSPLNGWGMPFSNLFDSSVEVVNKARPGRSTRTFVREGLWQEVVGQLQEGDYVLIQFGHNDEAKDALYRDRYTPVADYADYLTRFVRDVRDRRGIPILITPVTRMVFDGAGRAQETHAVYSAAVWEVGRRLGVPVVDLDSMSRSLLQGLGPVRSRDLFMQLDTLENPHYPLGQQDNTHFTEYGARKMAELVLGELRRLRIGLADRIYRPVVMQPSMAGVTGVPDTSFNMQSAYKHTVNSNPETRWVAERRYASVRERLGIEYCVSAGGRRLVLDAFYPAGKGSGKTAIVIVFGGGWRSGNRTMHYPLAKKLADLGYVCFTPDYRLSTEALYPAAIYDIKAAMRWVRQHALEYGVDSSRIAVLGFSAGGEIASFIGTTGGMPNFEGPAGCSAGVSAAANAVIDIDGTLSFVHPETGEGNDSLKTSAATYWFGYPRKVNPFYWDRASPLTYVDSHTPPTLFLNSSLARMHAGRDDYLAVLNKYHIYSEVHAFPNAPHCFCLFEPWFTPTVGYIDEFLKKAFDRGLAGGRIAATVMNRWPDSFALAGEPVRWSYDMGVILKGMEGLWRNSGDSVYFRYIQRQMDYFIGEDGAIRGYHPDEYNLDYVNNGKLALLLYKATGYPKYMRAAERLRAQLSGQPRTAGGGFWHKKVYTQQMWLDGLYMSGPFYAEYTSMHGGDTSLRDVTRQFVLIASHTRDSRTGLLYHGWDASGQQRWADPVSGHSPLFWGRAMGWYACALVDALDWYPAGDPGRVVLTGILKRLVAAVGAVQDPGTGLWKDVLAYDGPGAERNYFEASASCQFVYAIAKGVRKGYLPAGDLGIAKKGYAGILRRFIRLGEDGFYHLEGTVKVSGLGGNPYRDGSFGYYMSEPVIEDDPKGLGAFLLAAGEMERGI